MDLSKAKELSINGQPVAKLQVGDVVIWEKGGEREWKLDENGYIIGVDGKYYQRLYDDSEMVENNPVPDLNSQWVVDTVSGALNIDKNYDYYMSNSNYHVGNGYAQFKVTWSGLESVTFLYRSYAETACDYLVINGLDKPAFTSIPSSSTSGIIAHTSTKQTTTYSTIKIDTPDKGEHFIWFCYRKDSSADRNSDRAFVGVPNNCKSGEIYEKQGAELRYEYLQSDEYVLSEREGYLRYKYYKTYFSPNNAHQFRTDDYILGEEVPATPITANYLRFDAVDNPVHIGFTDLNLVTDMEYSMGYEETFTRFTSNGVDIPQGKSIWLKASGMATSNVRTFTTSAPVECHGDVRSLLNKTNFTSAPLTQYCFYGLFQDSKITTVPELPATTLVAFCYFDMFNNCTNLTSVPENLLPATTLANNCYYEMFKLCSNLTNAPVLPATTLASYCYATMFNGCRSLISAPALPATTLVSGCYNAMFGSCTSLTSAPELPAKTLVSGCYDYMFYGCNKINYIKVGATSWTTGKESWVSGVALSGTFVKYEGIDIPTGASGIPTGWTVEEIPTTPITANYLRFDAVDNPVHIGFTNLNLVTDMEYSMGYEETFTRFTSNGVDIPQGKSIWLRARGTSTNRTKRTFTTSAEVECHGDVRSLLHPTDFEITPLTDNCFYGLFSGSGITTAPELKSMDLGRYCYDSMFQEANSLTTAPDLPATTLTYHCYEGMFDNNSGLVHAPAILPATTLPDGVNSVYIYMFNKCVNLENAPEIMLNDMSTVQCTKMFHMCEKINYIKVHSIGSWSSQSDWVKGVAETGTFVKPASISIPTGTSGIPIGWEVEEYETHTPITANYLRFDATTNDVHIGVNNLTYFNNSLSYSRGEEEGWTSFPSDGVDIPQGETIWLKAGSMSTTTQMRFFTTSAEVECHGNIMSLLGNLTRTTTSNYCFYGLFRNTNITTAPELPATYLATYCYAQMFSGCASLTAAPELPATSLSTYCYYYMFYECTGLTAAPELPARSLSSYCYECMFRGCRNISYIKVGAISWNTSYTNSWVLYLPSSGTFVKPASTSIPTGYNGIPDGWTVEAA